MAMAVDLSKKGPQLVRFPFMDSTTIRGDTTKDRRFVNGYFEPVIDRVSQNTQLFFQKRPGFSTLQTVAGNPRGRGLYSLKKNNSQVDFVYAVFASTISKFASDNFAQTDLYTSLNSALTKVGFAETRPGATTQYLGVNDGTGLYLIQTDNSVLVMNNVVINTSSVANPSTITTATNHNLVTGNKIIIRNHVGSTPSINDTIFVITRLNATQFTIPVNVTVGGTGGTIGVFPTPNTSDLVYMDGYWFTMKTDGSIWNCSVDDPTTWSITSFIFSQMYNGFGIALARQNNVLLAFSDRHIQMFYDAANPVGSPLANIEQAVQQIGCISANTIAQQENTIFWVSDSGTGGFTLWKLDGTTNLKSVGVPQINRQLFTALATGGFPNSIQGTLVRTAGHLFYVLLIKTTGTGSNTCYVYDVDLDVWFEWTPPVITGTTQVNQTNNVNFLWAQGESNGKLYGIAPVYFQDDSSNFTMTAQTSPLDFGNMYREFYNRVEVIGDKQTSSAPVNISYSDDDYQTFSTPRTFDMANSRAYGFSWGNSRRRVWRFDYSGNNTMRVEGFEFELEFQAQ